MPDVVVIGGGPAGAATAIACARAGLEVVIFDGRAHPVDRPGETLHPGVEALLDQLGVGDAVRGAGFLRHTGITLERNGQSTFVPYGGDSAGPWRGFQAWRSSFDALLLRAAADAGSSVRRGASVLAIHALQDGGAVVEAGGERLRARWLVDASGSRHWLGKQLRLPLRKLSPKLVCWWGYFEAPSGEPPAFCDSAEGWRWCAEVKAGVYQWTQLSYRHPRASGAPQTGKLRGADVTWRWYPACAGDGYFMVGDAAAVFDPSSSHGVLRALMSGMYAAHLINAAQNDNRLVRVVTQHYRQWLGDWVRHDATSLQQLRFRPRGIAGDA